MIRFTAADSTATISNPISRQQWLPVKQTAAAAPSSILTQTIHYHYGIRGMGFVRGDQSRTERRRQRLRAPSPWWRGRLFYREEQIGPGGARRSSHLSTPFRNLFTSHILSVESAPAGWDKLRWRRCRHSSLKSLVEVVAWTVSQCQQSERRTNLCLNEVYFRFSPFPDCL